MVDYKTKIRRSVRQAWRHDADRRQEGAVRQGQDASTPTYDFLDAYRLALAAAADAAMTGERDLPGGERRGNRVPRSRAALTGSGKLLPSSAARRGGRPAAARRPCSSSPAWQLVSLFLPPIILPTPWRVVKRLLSAISGTRRRSPITASRRPNLYANLIYTARERRDRGAASAPPSASLAGLVTRALLASSAPSSTRS